MRDIDYDNWLMNLDSQDEACECGNFIECEECRYFFIESNGDNPLLHDEAIMGYEFDLTEQTLYYVLIRLNSSYLIYRKAYENLFGTKDYDTMNMLFYYSDRIFKLYQYMMKFQNLVD